MNGDEVHAAAVALVERSTAASKVPLVVEDAAVAAVVADVLRRSTREAVDNAGTVTR